MYRWLYEQVYVAGNLMREMLEEMLRGTSRGIVGLDPRTIPGCTVWFDAADPATFGLSGTSLQTWRSKGSVSCTATYKYNAPSVSTIGGLSTIYFNGVSTMMTTNTVASYGATETTWITCATNFATVSSSTPADACPVIATQGAGAERSIRYTCNVNATAYSINTSVLRQTTGDNTNGVRGFIDTAAYFAGFTNGALIASNTTAVTFQAGTNQSFVMGQWNVGWLNGYVNEILIYNRALSLGEYQSVEGYLAQKWGFSLAKAFKPTSIPGCQLWLDGADQSSVTFSSGSNVSQWNDKSGNGLNATVLNGTPTYTQALGMTFNGSSALQVNYTASPTIETLFVIIKFNSVSAQGNIFSGTAMGQREYLLFSPYSPGTIYLGRYGNGPSGSINGGTVITSSNYMLGYVFNGTANTISFYQGGNVTSSGTPQFTYSSGGTISAIGSYNGNGYLQGQIYELIVYSTALTAVQRQQIEGYLAWKWNLQGSLTSTHPYYLTTGNYLNSLTLAKTHPFYSQVPMSRPFTPLDLPGCTLWLDAADQRTMTFSGTSNITTWSDKSGVNNSLSNTTGNPPYFTTYNGYQTISFRGSMATTSNALSNQTFSVAPANISIFLVTQELNNGNYGSANQYPGILTIFPNPLSGSDYLNGLAIDGGNNSTVIMEVYGGGSTNTQTTGMGYSGSGFTPYKVYSFTNTSNVMTAYGNGTLWGTTTFNYNTTNVGIVLGMRFLANVITSTTNASAYDGNISEILIYNNALGEAQRQQVEGYLAAKWGLLNDLPGKKLSPLSISGCTWWLDGADPAGTGIAPANNTSLETWVDKSGNTRNASAASAATYTSNGISFSSGNFYTMNVPYSSNYSIFLVATNTSIPQTYFFARNSLGGGRFPTFIQGYIGNGIGLEWYEYDNRATIATTPSSPFLASVDHTQGTNITGWYNGSQAFSIAQTQGYATNAWDTLGQSGYTANYYAGYMKEIIFFGSVLTTSQRQSIENYLMSKWGIGGGTLHPFKSIPPTTRQPALYYDVAPGNWSRDWQPYLQRLTAANSSGLTITTSNITGGATFIGSGWTGSVLAPNGNIYSTPFYATNILVLNPTTDVTSNLTGGATFPGGGSWIGGVLAPNGNIYFCPHNAANILVLNPTSGVTSNLTGGATYTTGGWLGGVLGPNGNIYFPPYQAANILVLNPTSGVTSNLTGGATLSANSASWTGSVLAPNGNIYFSPYYAANILVLNPTTGVTSNLTGGATYTPGGWYGGVLAPNGNIYFCPHNAANILVLNPTTGVTSNLTGGATYTTGGWIGGVLGPNGNIYFTPFSATNILVLNPTTGVTSNLTGGATFAGSGSWYGGKLAPNGTIYFSPFGTANVLKLTFSGLSQTPSSNYCLSALTNKY